MPGGCATTGEDANAPRDKIIKTARSSIGDTLDGKGIEIVEIYETLLPQARRKKSDNLIEFSENRYSDEYTHRPPTRVASLQDSRAASVLSGGCFTRWLSRLIAFSLGSFSDANRAEMTARISLAAVTQGQKTRILRAQIAWPA